MTVLQEEEEERKKTPSMLSKKLSVDPWEDFFSYKDGQFSSEKRNQKKKTTRAGHCEQHI